MAAASGSQPEEFTANWSPGSSHTWVILNKPRPQPQGPKWGEKEHFIGTMPFQLTSDHSVQIHQSFIPVLTSVIAVGHSTHHILQGAAAAEFVSKLEGDEEVGGF